MDANKIRIGLPSKGRIHGDTLDFLDKCGLPLFRPNPRQYICTIPALPDTTVILQRPGDIVNAVESGSAAFGIVGLDMVREKVGDDASELIILHDALGFSRCAYFLAAANDSGIDTLDDLRTFAQAKEASGDVLRVASKFSYLTTHFLDKHNIRPYSLISAEGTLEIAPAVGYADIIADLVSTGTTLRDNQLHIIDGSEILRSQAVLIANRSALRENQTALEIARMLIEYIEAHLRAKECWTVVANMRGDSAESVAAKLHAHPTLGGLNGPTISTVYSRASSNTNWFAIHIIVKKRELNDAISSLRDMGGSGVIVSPVTYIFEEEPARYRAMLQAIAG